jgi:hypothetical protein
MKIKYLSFSLAMFLMGASVSASSVKKHTLEYTEETQTPAKSIKAKKTKKPKKAVQPYTKAGVLRLFTHEILTGEPRATFKQFLDIMFSKKFGKPPHNATQINKGWRCLRDRVKTQESTEDKLAEIYKTLGFHKNRIAHFNPTLAATIPDFSCESCKEVARSDAGIETTPND